MCGWVDPRDAKKGTEQTTDHSELQLALMEEFLCDFLTPLLA